MTMPDRNYPLISVNISRNYLPMLNTESDSRPKSWTAKGCPCPYVKMTPTAVRSNIVISISHVSHANTMFALLGYYNWYVDPHITSDLFRLPLTNSMQAVVFPQLRTDPHRSNTSGGIHDHSKWNPFENPKSQPAYPLHRWSETQTQEPDLTAKSIQPISNLILNSRPEIR